MYLCISSEKWYWDGGIGDEAENNTVAVRCADALRIGNVENLPTSTTKKI